MYEGFSVKLKDEGDDLRLDLNLKLDEFDWPQWGTDSDLTLTVQ